MKHFQQFNNFLHTDKARVISLWLNRYNQPTDPFTITAVNVLYNAQNYSDEFIDKRTSYYPLSQSFIFSVATGETYKPNDKHHHSLVASINKALQSLTGLVHYSKASKVLAKANHYKFNDEAYTFLVEASYRHIFINPISQLTLDNADLLDSIQSKPSLSQLTSTDYSNPQLVQLVSKLSSSQYKLDISLLRYYEEKTKHILHLPEKERSYILNQLLSLNLFSNKPQYHNDFAVQNSGRIHNIGSGSLINLTKIIRHNLVIPIKPHNRLYEFDFIAAQTLYLYEYFQLDSTLLIKALRDKTFWTSFNKPKDTIKPMHYAYLFGSNAPYSKVGLTKEDYYEYLRNPFILPLKKPRKDFLSTYSDINLSTPKRIINALNRRITLSPITNEPNKAARTALAHIAVGGEQKSIQPILNALSYPISVFQYDGFTIELSDHPDVWILLLGELATLTDIPFSLEEVIPLRDIDKHITEDIYDSDVE